ncbi:hypothetical protein D4R42_01375 [bacterium]|nr:MAG: hypothetical protein D4R42_01375 [bacterium]
MNIIATKPTDKDLEEHYELFEVKEMKDIEDKDVSVKVSLGLYTLDQLNADKALYEEKLADINDMIEAIENIINQTKE